MGTMDEAFYENSHPMSWQEVVLTYGANKRATYLQELEVHYSKLFYAVVIMFLAIIFTMCARSLSYTWDIGLAVTVIIFLLLLEVQIILELGSAFVNNRRFRHKLNTVKSNKYASALTFKAVEDIIFDTEISGELVGFLETSRKQLWVLRGLPVSQIYMVFDDPCDQVLFVIKHGLVKSDETFSTP